MEKYTFEEYKKLIELGIQYRDLKAHKRIIVLPCPLESMVYQVVPDCERCARVKSPALCREDKRNCKKKVMPCLFTLDLLESYGKTVFGTETEAIVASVS